MSNVIRSGRTLPTFATDDDAPDVAPERVRVNGADLRAQLISRSALVPAADVRGPEPGELITRGCKCLTLDDAGRRAVARPHCHEGI